MTWAARFRRRESIRHSLWLVPLLGALVGMLLAWGADRAGSRLDMPSELTFTPSTASSVLSAILGAMIGLVGFVVTVTVLLVQTSTSQFSARYMRLVYRDRLLKAVLAVLVGTFAYSFVLLRRVGETEAPTSASSWSAGSSSSHSSSSSSSSRACCSGCAPWPSPPPSAGSGARRSSP
jgi:uncharacterized membrane protein